MKNEESLTKTLGSLCKQIKRRGSLHTSIFLQKDDSSTLIIDA